MKKKKNEFDLKKFCWFIALLCTLVFPIGIENLLFFRAISLHFSEVSKKFTTQNCIQTSNTVGLGRTMFYFKMFTEIRQNQKGNCHTCMDEQKASTYQADAALHLVCFVGVPFASVDC